MNNTRKSKSPSRGVAAMMESVAEIQNFVDQGMSIEDVKRHYRRHEPDRIRTGGRVSPGASNVLARRRGDAKIE
jgi:hypothetical protein